MKRVLVVQPSLQPPGGSNGVAAWVLQALVPEHRVTVLSWWPVDVGPVNRFFGTHLNRSDFDTITVPPSWRALVDHWPVPAALLRLSLLMRFARRVSADFEIVFGVFNEVDFGRRAIQYVHYPTYLRPRPRADVRWYHPPRVVLEWYYAMADRIAGFSLDRMKKNVTLVNSNWTGAQMQRFLGVETRTVYPPVADPAPPLPWSERRNGFLAIGRISPEKEYERIIAILARVRERVPDITLTIVGTSDRHTRRYFRHLTSKAASIGAWIQFRDNLTRDEVRQLMASHRYGIHGMREEHFGMAPAELVRAGAIVWVPRGGGQMEVVGNEPALMYASEDEAVEQIVRTVGDGGEQARLRDVLRTASGHFSTETFMRDVRAVVSGFPGAAPRHDP